MDDFGKNHKKLIDTFEKQFEKGVKFAKVMAVLYFIFIVIVAIVVLVLMTGCEYGGRDVQGEGGKTYGYITTVESGVGWDFIWMRASLESSNTDCYKVAKSDTKLLEKLSEYAKSGDRVEVQFKRLFLAFDFSPSNQDCWDDEITGVEKA